MSLLELFSLRVKEVEPLIEKGKKIFERCFDKEIKEHKEDIDLRDTLGEFAPDTYDRHKEEVYEQSTDTLFLPYPIDMRE